MRTIPTAITDELVKDEHSFVVVYEIDKADSTTLRVSSQDLTWPASGGDAYTAQAIKSGVVEERLQFHIPTLKLDFTNIDEFWRAHLEPDDEITGRPIRQRLLVRDAITGALKDDSHVLFDGLVERIESLTETRFVLKAVGKIAGLGTRIPRRRTSLFCNARFADGIDCNYVRTGVTDGAGSGTTIAVIPDDTMADFEVGQAIQVANKPERTITAVRTSPDEIDINFPITWSDADEIKYLDCTRQFGRNGGCQSRGRRHEFLGFLGVDQIARAADQLDVPKAARGRQPSDDAVPRGFAFFKSPDPEPTADPSSAVPLAYGRVFTRGRLIEATTARWSGQDLDKDLVLRWKLLGEGEFDSIVNFYKDGRIGSDKFDDAGKKVSGIFIRLGGLGVDDTESAYASQVLPQKRDQNRFSKSKMRYSRSCVVLEITPADKDQEFQYDAKARKVQEYDDLGAPVGAEAFSDNNIWCAIDVLLNKRFGLGNTLAAADLDFAVADASADVVGETIDGATSEITADNTGALKTHIVKDARGFVRGMAIEIDGNPAGTIVDVPQRNAIKTDTNYNSLPGDPIVARVPRFSCNGILESGDRGSRALVAILRACNGYVTYDGTLIQLRIEKAEASSVAHFRDTGYDLGYGMQEGSFKWLPAERDLETNAIVARYNNQSIDQGADIEPAVDWRHVGDNEYAEKTIDLPMVHNPHQAFRLAKRRLDKIRLFGTGAKFVAQPIALKIQPGDVIEVTHPIPGWTAEFKRVTRKRVMGLGKDDELFVELTVEDYVNIYDDTGDPLPFVEAYDDPALTLSVTSDENNRIILSWVFDNSVYQIDPRGIQFSVYKSDSPSVPIDDDVLLASRIRGNQYVYQVPPSEIGTTLYFVVVFTGGATRLRREIVSNEIDVTPSGATVIDPTAGAGPFYNLLWGGDFDGEMSDTDADDIPDYHPNWELTVPTGGETDVRPNAHVAGNWSNPANAYDTGAGSDDTYADVVLSNPPQYQNESIDFTFASGTKTGRFEVTMQHLGRWNKGSVDFLLSIDGGSNFTLIGGFNSNAGKDTKSSGYYTALDMSQVVVRVKGTANTEPTDHEMRAFTVRFLESTLVAPWARIASSILTLHGNGTLPAVAARPFPGPTPDSGVQVFAESDEAVIWTQFRAAATVTVDPTVYLVDRNTGDEWLLATIPGAAIPVGTGASDWAFRTFRWQAPAAAIAANLYFEIRSVFNGAIEMPNVGIYPGAEVPTRWWAHIDEIRQSRPGDRSVGRPLAFTRGTWGNFPTGRGSLVTGATR